MRRPLTRRIVRAGIQSIAAGTNSRRHQHAAGYVTLVLDGAYEQIGYAGRLRLGAGDLLVQPFFDCHANTMLSVGLKVMRLPWRYDPTFGGVWRGLDVDCIRRIGEKDSVEAARTVDFLLGVRPPEPPMVDHWVDMLAAELAARPPRKLTDWARAGGVTRELAARAFRIHYGVSPSEFRTEVRARAAVIGAVGSDDPLASVAVEVGFNDQAHMTRAVTWLTGFAPGQWRRRARDGGDLSAECHARVWRENNATSNPSAVIG